MAAFFIFIKTSLGPIDGIGTSSSHKPFPAFDFTIAFILVKL